MANPGAFDGGADLERLKTILAGWRASLVDLSGRNRLLNFRHTRSSTLEIVSPTAHDLLAKLDRGWDFAPLPDEEPESGDAEAESHGRLPAKTSASSEGIVTQKTTGPALLRALGSLRGKSVQLFNDYGLWTLNLGVGMLNWREDGAQSGSDAPLILLPVKIERLANGRMKLRTNDEEEPRLNPALAVKLEQFSLDWTPVTEQDPLDMEAVLAAATRAVEGKPGWEVSPRVVVALFASHKESMYQDLLDNEDRVLASELVRVLASGSYSGLATDRFDFEEIDLDRIDELSPPEDSPLVLDADASQRQAVAAAVAGQSFVLDGPPGTGKSQTITNMIAGLMHAGRSVLFVSEKAAALDVVLDRLRSVGLDSYALALHSHNTSRKAIAKELGRSLSEEPQAPQLSQQAVSRARETRQSLNAYAEAMNEVREPLGQTLHDVIGQVGRLAEAPVAFLSADMDATSDGPQGFRAESVGNQDLQLIVEATQRIAAAWEAVADPSFPWRDLREDRQHPRPSLDQARAALQGLTTAISRYRALSVDGEPASEDSDVRRLLALLLLLDCRHQVPETWLTTDRFADTVDEPVDAFLKALRALQRARSAARGAAGERWQELSARLSAAPDASEQALSTLSPPAHDLAALTEDRAAELAEVFAATADTLDRTHQSLVDVGRLAGLETPNSLEDARQVCEVLAVAGTDHRPLDSWLTAGGATAVEEAAVRVTADALGEFFARRDKTLAARALAEAQAGPGWERMSAELSAHRPADEVALDELGPSAVDITGLSRRQAEEHAESFQRLAETLDQIEADAGTVLPLLGCTRPQSTAEVQDLVELIESGAWPNRAPQAWFDPEVLPRARAAVADISAAASELRDAEHAASETFRPETVHTPGLPDAVRRLAEGARGIGGTLSGAIRADRKALGGLTHGGKWRGELYDKIELAGTWHSAHNHLRSLGTSYGELIGRYTDGELPDDVALRQALEHAETVHRLAPGTVADSSRRGLLAGQLADGRTPPTELDELGAALRREIGVWKDGLTASPLATCATELAKQSPADAAQWLRAHLAPLRQAIDLLDTVTATGRGEAVPTSEHTLASARRAITVAHAAQRETAAFVGREQDDRRLLGPWYRGLDTDPTGLQDTAVQCATEQPAVGTLLRQGAAMNRRQPSACASDADRELLGRYATEGRPDSAALCAAIESVQLVVTLAPLAVADPVRRSLLAGLLADGRPVPHQLLRTAEQINRELVGWAEFTRGAQCLSVGQTTGQALAAMSLAEAAAWLRAHVVPFDNAADLIRSAARVMTEGAALTLARSREAVAAVAAARAAEERFAENDTEYRGLLGPLYRGGETDRDEILDAVEWAQKVRRTAHGSLSAPLSASAARLMLSAEPDSSVRDRNDEWQRQREAFVAYFDPERAKDLRGELANSLVAADRILSRLDNDPYGPEAWTSCAEALSLLRRYGLDGLPAQLAQRQVSAADFPAAVERAVLTAWIEHQLAVDVRLKPMRAVERDQLVDQFRQYDRELVRAAHADVIAACNARRPRRTSVGQAALIRRESEKQRRHMPVRHLLAQTRDVVQAIKPCFMMSPLTVSQFLAPDFTFDVVIFDEASQVLPQDAVNSVYRGNALIVAGDQKQLPPTSFFSAGGDSEDDEWDEDALDSFGSVLDVCRASDVLRGLPLRWHYRSRHENLIAFSNHEFYEGTMVTFPGALESGSDIGVEFIKADGVYDRGGRSNNPGEAATVAQRVIHHFTERPGLTLGVVALSKSQAEAIEEAVQKARAGRPDLDEHFTEGRLDGFFVKNLETVQGDERDVVILSVGYGPDQHGKLSSSFGPINREGGWRRLNVAVTRARRRMEVVASFYGGDLPESTNKSVRHLKRYLEYAQHGPHILMTEAADPKAEPESPFEEEVLDVLRGWGHEVQPQVGVAGFRIDMAVRHPSAPGTYALGIECDGAMYHSSRAARDRDRLRESVLRDLGWQLYRIWGTDWYRNRRDAIKRLQDAVDAACAKDPHTVRAAPPPPVASAQFSGAPEEVAGPAGAEEEGDTAEVGLPSAQAVTFVPVDAGPSEWSRPYQEVEPALLTEVRLRSADRRGMRGVELQDPDAAGVVADVALCVVEVEGPIEEELLFTRVRRAWNANRSGKVIQDRIRRALRRLVSEGKIVRTGTAYDRPGHEVEFARTPTPRCDRKRVAQVPAVERRLVLRRVVEEGPGVPREELLREGARFFGWARIGADIREAFTRDIDELIAEGTLRETTSGLMPTENE
ncbi:DUF3320 domain-containing protein [Streptomyces olivaceiscleroticus]|uniref:DNA helicase n=1 Tax=Streptomyces olivaceiscleroticus TaxID=68245 RepID=A0ABN1AG94_9ACTN